MRFIKKLVILTGNGARGTLLLEKNGFGVWGKLNLFDFRMSGCKFVIMSGDDLFAMKIQDKRDQSINFELGEMNFDEIHAAVISDRVIMYGSNCATKLPFDVIMQRAARHEKRQREEESYITFSGRDKKIEDYFKQIAPPLYNDFAIAEKNYYPAYVTVIGEDDNVAAEQNDNMGTVIIRNNEDAIRNKKETETSQKEFLQDTKASKTEQIEVTMEQKRLMPHELEQIYLSRLEAAATTHKHKEETIEVSETPAASPKISITPAEKPEVIAMARRITLRDYKVEGAKKTGRRATFFERSSAQLEKLMADNERFPAAERLIPGSKFVKINYDQKRYYIVGVIGRDYICYGVPSVYSLVPPEPLLGYARWLPFDADKPQAEGFWMMYQDGVSGETLKS